MECIHKDLGSYQYHFIPTKEFKTITLRVVFHTPIVKEDITKRLVLSDILFQSSNKYRSKRELTIQAEELYAADISIHLQRVGNYLFTNFNLQVLEDQYTEEGNLEKSFAFLQEILFSPDVKKSSFSKEKLDIVKNKVRVNIDSMKEDAKGYSLLRLMENYDKESPISYRMIGYLEDLEKIDGENLYETYQKMIQHDYVDIFVIGDFDSQEMLEKVKKYFHFPTVKKRKKPYALSNKKIRKRKLYAKETISNSQSKLGIVCPLSKMSDYEKNYSMVLANLILGGGTDSKLFQNVREKNSLCYTIYSNYQKLDQALIISAGIDRVNYKKTVELIQKNIGMMKKGKITNQEIQMAKEFYLSSLESVYESQNSMIHECMAESILGLDPIDQRREIMRNVKKGDIVKASKKIHMDTIFLLEGIGHEEEV